MPRNGNGEVVAVLCTNERNELDGTCQDAVIVGNIFRRCALLKKMDCFGIIIVRSSVIH